MTVSFTGVEGRARRRLQFPKPHEGSTSCLPAKEAMTLVGLAASTTSSLRMVAGTGRRVLEQEVVGDVEPAVGPREGEGRRVGHLDHRRRVGVLDVIPGGSGPYGESPAVPAPVAGAGPAVMSGADVPGNGVPVDVPGADTPREWSPRTCPPTERCRRRAP